MIIDQPAQMEATVLILHQIKHYYCLRSNLRMKRVDTVPQVTITVAVAVDASVTLKQTIIKTKIRVAVASTIVEAPTNKADRLHK